jgi:hypothetical protein
MASIPLLRAGLRATSRPFWRALRWCPLAPVDSAKRIRRTINRYKRLLASEHDPKSRQAIIRLLSEEEANLRRIHSRPDSSAARFRNAG